MHNQETLRSAALAFAGIDVSKDHLDVCLDRSGKQLKTQRFANDPEGHEKLLRWLGTSAMPSVKQEGAFPVFERLFREYGLPEAVRTDNGNPFATQALCGLSKLSVWWIKLGIGHQRIEPGQPQQNGRHERMHRTLKSETTRPPEQNMACQQERFDCWRAEFNEERPHEALGGSTPGSAYRPSRRAMPATLPKPEYPAHLEVRRVSRCGTFRHRSRQLFLSQALNEEHIALEETGDGVWSVYFYDVLLARLNERDFQLVAAVP